MKQLLRCLTLLAALLVAGCEHETVEVEVGYRGPARRDPFLAAERFLEQRGWDVKVQTKPQKNLPDGETLFTTAHSLADSGMMDDVFAWVARGGQLLVVLKGGEPFSDDWMKFSFHLFETESREQKALMEQLGVGNVESQSTESAEDDVHFEINGGKGVMKMPSRFTWKNGFPPGGAKIIAGDANKPAIASFPHGAGIVTVVADSQPLRNRYISEADHAWLLEQLVGLNRSETVWFLQATRLSFFGMLWEHGWMALIPCAVLLVLWLWKNFPRFGPLRHPQDAAPRQFSEHLALTGGFLWHHHESCALLEPLQRAITTAAERRGWSPKSPDFCTRLAERASLPPERVEAALASREVKDARLFEKLMQDLQRISETF